MRLDVKVGSYVHYTYLYIGFDDVWKRTRELTYV